MDFNIIYFIFAVIVIRESTADTSGHQNVTKIDYSSNTPFASEKEMEAFLEKELSEDAYANLTLSVDEIKEILYLAFNPGHVTIRIHADVDLELYREKLRGIFQQNDLSVISPEEHEFPLKEFREPLELLALNTNHTKLRQELIRHLETMNMDEARNVRKLGIVNRDRNDEAVIIIPYLFKGLYKVISPIIQSHFPEFSKTAIVKVGDRFMRYLIYKELQDIEDSAVSEISLERLPHIPVGKDAVVSFEMLRLILNSLYRKDNLLLLPAKFIRSFGDGFFPLSLWNDIYHAVNSNANHYIGVLRGNNGTVEYKRLPWIGPNLATSVENKKKVDYVSSFVQMRKLPSPFSCSQLEKSFQNVSEPAKNESVSVPYSCIKTKNLTAHENEDLNIIFIQIPIQFVKSNENFSEKGELNIDIPGLTNQSVHVRPLLCSFPKYFPPGDPKYQPITINCILPNNSSAGTNTNSPSVSYSCLKSKSSKEKSGSSSTSVPVLYDCSKRVSNPHSSLSSSIAGYKYFPILCIMPKNTTEDRNWESIIGSVEEPVLCFKEKDPNDYSNSEANVKNITLKGAFGFKNLHVADTYPWIPSPKNITNHESDVSTDFWNSAQSSFPAYLCTKLNINKEIKKEINGSMTMFTFLICMQQKNRMANESEVSDLDLIPVPYICERNENSHKRENQQNNAGVSIVPYTCVMPKNSSQDIGEVFDIMPYTVSLLCLIPNTSNYGNKTEFDVGFDSNIFTCIDQGRLSYEKSKEFPSTSIVETVNKHLSTVIQFLYSFSPRSPSHHSSEPRGNFANPSVPVPIPFPFFTSTAAPKPKPKSITKDDKTLKDPNVARDSNEPRKNLADPSVPVPIPFPFFTSTAAPKPKPKSITDDDNTLKDPNAAKDDTGLRNNLADPSVPVPIPFPFFTSTAAPKPKPKSITDDDKTLKDPNAATDDTGPRNNLADPSVPVPIPFPFFTSTAAPKPKPKSITDDDKTLKDPNAARDDTGPRNNLADPSVPVPIPFPFFTSTAAPKPKPKSITDDDKTLKDPNAARDDTGPRNNLADPSVPVPIPFPFFTSTAAPKPKPKSITDDDKTLKDPNVARDSNEPRNNLADPSVPVPIPFPFFTSTAAPKPKPKSYTNDDEALKDPNGIRNSNEPHGKLANPSVPVPIPFPFFTSTPAPAPKPKSYTIDGSSISSTESNRNNQNLNYLYRMFGYLHHNRSEFLDNLPSLISRSLADEQLSQIPVYNLKSCVVYYVENNVTKHAVLLPPEQCHSMNAQQNAINTDSNSNILPASRTKNKVVVKPIPRSKAAHSKDDLMSDVESANESNLPKLHVHKNFADSSNVILESSSVQLSENKNVNYNDPRVLRNRIKNIVNESKRRDIAMNRKLMKNKAIKNSELVGTSRNQPMKDKYLLNEIQDNFHGEKSIANFN